MAKRGRLREEPVLWAVPDEGCPATKSFYHELVGRTLIILGLVLVVAGIILTFGERLPIKLGRLPGDIVIRGKNGVFYFPIVTCLIVSAVLSLVMWLIRRRG